MDPDPGGAKTRGSGGSGSGTLLATILKKGTDLHRRYGQCCGSGSGRIGIIMVDPDRHTGPAELNQEPDLYLYPFQPNVKLAYRVLFPQNLKILSKISKILTPMTLTRKKKDKTI